jgi:hypothetical protein
MRYDERPDDSAVELREEAVIRARFAQHRSRTGRIVTTMQPQEVVARDVIKQNRAPHLSEISPERVCAVHVLQKHRYRSLDQILQLRCLRRTHRGDEIVERRSRATLHPVQKCAIDVAPARCYFSLL